MLEGVRVVELTQGLAGSIAGVVLAECGADVLKIEPPGGDPSRGTAAFASTNRSKRSLELDVHTQGGRDRLEALLADADVLLHPFPTSAARAMQLDEDSLAKRFPRLISCAILGYPIGHANEDALAIELLVQAASGVLSEQDGYRDGPIVYRYEMGEMGASQLALAAILTRLIVRHDTGLGGGAHTSLLQGMFGPMSLCWSRIERGAPPELFIKPSVGRLHPTLYQCKDGKWLQIIDPTGKLDYAAMPLMWEVLGELGYSDVDDMDRRREAYARRPSDDWLAALRALDTAVEATLELGELLKHPEAQANSYVVRVKDDVWGETLQAGAPYHLSDPVAVRSAAPPLNNAQGAGWRERQERAWPSKTIEKGQMPLKGFNVIDFGAFVAGPLAPQILGDLGADVIKIEPLTGDRQRFMVRYFQAANRNKRSIAVDLSKPQGQDILARLAKRADLAHHNMRMRAARKIGIDEAGLRKLNPNIIFSYSSAYGQQGERGDWPGYDPVFEALGGWEVENAGEGNPPVFMRAGCMDILCAFTSLVASLLAMYEARTTGKATSGAASLLGAASLTQFITLVKSNGEYGHKGRLDSAQTGMSARERIYQSANGWIAVSAKNEEQLYSAFGAASVGGVEQKARSLTNTDIIGLLTKAGIPAAEVLIDDYRNVIFDDESNKRTKVVVGYEHRDFGLIEQPGAYFGFDDLSLNLENPGPPPRLGEHTEEILESLGYSEKEIQDLFAANIVGGERRAKAAA
ncbi:MAG: CoA transferase [Caulobacterales bacterium]